VLSCLSHFNKLYFPFVISDTTEHAIPIIAGSPVSNKNLKKMFVEDAPQQVNKLENVRSLYN